MKRVTISGWGNYPSLSARVRPARHRGDLSRFARERPPLIATGNRRSYGDACLFSNVVSTLELNHILGFDADTGILRAEAGVTFDDVIRFALPLGWFPPVTPGTKFPTLGGCVAADVHGKNHHVNGSLGDHVDEIELILADGSEICCSPNHHPDLFRATLGGMGLTGFIYAVTLRLRKVPSAYIAVRREKAGNLGEALAMLSETQEAYTYSVAWIDCLARGRARGRSILMLGNHAEAEQLSTSASIWRPHSRRCLDFPVTVPEFVLNPLSMRLFNSAYYHRHLRRRSETIRHYDSYFYPLDAVGNWNRVYGRHGFLQYQLLVPFDGGADALDEILERISSRGTGSFLAVLKTFGKTRGMLSFPKPGYTLALDFPLSDSTIVAFLQEITTVVRGVGGRVYLAKDAVLKRDDFEAMYPELPRFKQIKKTYDPENHFRSAQSERLGIR